ncbi:MAG: Cache 3/Cache 2 fusion domain-containing protein [Bacteroidota bacterium]
MFSRVQIMMNSILLVIFILIGLFLYYNGRENAYSITQEQTYNKLEELGQIIDVYHVRDRDILNMATNFAEYKINEYSDIEESDSAIIEFEAVNPFTKSPMTVKIHEWFVDESPLLNNFYIVDEINLLTKTNASIYQKTPKGYVNVSTNILNTKEERLLGDIILNSSEIVQTIESGNQFKNRVYKNNSWYLTTYKPIYIDGKIRGMYYVGLKERFGMALKAIFDERKYLERGYAFIITKDGKLSIHPKEQGMDYSKTDMFKRLKKLKDKKGIFTYKWPETKKAKHWFLNFKYEETIDSYVCITVPRKEVYSQLNYRALYIILWFILFVIGFQLAFIYLNNQLKERLKVISKSIAAIAKGGRIDVIETESYEYKEVYEDVNSISERYTLLAKYADKLVKDQLGMEQSDLLKNDMIGNALIQVDEKLLKATEREKEGEKEANLRKWESEGLSKFVDILQQHTSDIQELSNDLVNDLVLYLNANQGALFFLNNENTNDVYFEQMATYAYDKKRLANKKIYPEEGLIGRIYSEKKTINLSEIPENYIKITSGLGELEPNYLLIVPLLLNMEVYGVIELASFNKFEDYQIEFIEKIGENIASTINNVQINTRTRKLLEQSREQSEKLALHEKDMKNSLVELKNAKAESDLKSLETEGILNAINSSLLVSEFSPDGIVQKINQNYLKLFDLKQNDLIGRSHSEFTSLDVELPEYKLFWIDLAKGISRKIEEHIKLPDGNEYWLNGYYSPILDKNNKVYKILNISIDITKVKELENKLKQGKLV